MLSRTVNENFKYFHYAAMASIFFLILRPGQSFSRKGSILCSFLKELGICKKYQVLKNAISMEYFQCITTNARSEMKWIFFEQS